VNRRYPSAQWKPKVNPWIIAATVAIAAFMEVLDTSIANVAFPHISGNLGASSNEGIDAVGLPCSTGCWRR
jgi:MFS transporter, DHA2 family, multidrug resistance protein